MWVLVGTCMVACGLWVFVVLFARLICPLDVNLKPSTWCFQFSMNLSLWLVVVDLPKRSLALRVQRVLACIVKMLGSFSLGTEHVGRNNRRLCKQAMHA